MRQSMRRMVLWTVLLSIGLSVSIARAQTVGGESPAAATAANSTEAPAEAPAVAAPAAAASAPQPAPAADAATKEPAIVNPALAARKAGREDLATYLRRRVELLTSVDELIKARPILNDLYSVTPQEASETKSADAAADDAPEQV